MWRSIVMGMAVAATAAACGGSPDESGDFGGGVAPVCEAGKVAACPCPGGGQGAQACAENGSGWGRCECGAGDAGGSGDATGGGAADAADADYEGPCATTCTGRTLTCIGTGRCTGTCDGVSVTNAECSGSCMGTCTYPPPFAMCYGTCE